MEAVQAAAPVAVREAAGAAPVVAVVVPVAAVRVVAEVDREGAAVQGAAPVVVVEVLVAEVLAAVDRVVALAAGPVVVRAVREAAVVRRFQVHHFPRAPAEQVAKVSGYRW